MTVVVTVPGPVAPTLVLSSVRVSAMPVATDVLAHLGWPLDSPDDLALATEHLACATDLAHAYTRGRGFTPDGAMVASGIAAVLVRAAARSMTNPTADRSEHVGGLQADPGSFAGWSIVETVTLNGWRVRVG